MSFLGFNVSLHLSFSRSRFARLAALPLLGLLAFTGLAAHAQIRVTARVPVGISLARAGEFNLTYRLLVTNTGAAATNVTAVATSYAPSTTIVQGNLTFPNIAAGGEALSTNTYVVQVAAKELVDLALIDPSLIRFVFSGISTPVANAGPDQLIQGTCCMLDGGQSYDPFGLPLTYTWSVVSEPTNSAAGLYPLGVVGEFIPDLPGDYELELVVGNGSHTSAPSYLHLSTVAVAPKADAGYDRTIKAGETVQLDGSHSVNPMNRPLTYAWSVASAPLGLRPSISNPTSAQPTFVPRLPGDYKLQLVVTDGALSSAPATVSYSTVYTPARADAGPDMHISSNSYGFLSANRSTDVDGRMLTYRWVVLSGDTGGVPGLDLDPVPNPDLQVEGYYHIQLFVNDGYSDSVATQVVSFERLSPYLLSATATVLPAIATVDKPTTPGMFTFDGTLTQASDVINWAGWTLREAPAGSTAQLTPSGNGMTAAITPDENGLYIAQFQTDSQGFKNYPTAVSFLTHGGPPVANPGTTQFGLWTAPALHTLSGSGSYDPEGRRLTYHWSLLNRPVGSNAALSSTTAVSPTFTADVDGTYIFQLIVNNGVADSAPATVSIISKDSTAPVAYDETVQYPWKSPCIPVTLHGNDPLLDPYSYGGQILSVPSFGFLSSFGALNGQAGFPFPLTAVPGFPLANYGNWGTNGTPADNPDGRIGAETLCYIPFSQTFVGNDSFTYSVWDQGYPSGCFTPGNYCIAPKESAPGTITIQIFETNPPPI